MAVETKITVDDCMIGALNALIEGDLHTRDVLCAMAERIIRTQPQPGGISVMDVDKDALN